MEAILSAQQVSLGIKNKITLVENIQFDLFEREIMAVIGPNGCGKSSFIKTLIGQLDVLSGSLNFLGQDLTKLHHKSRSRSIALMGQNNTVEPHMRVREYLELGRFPHFHHCTRQDDRECVEQMIDEMQLAPLLTRRMNELSGGEFQRINLARVLIQTPQLLLLDEPTNHLDPLARIALLKHVKEKKITTIMVLHDLNLVEYFADKVLAIHQGKMAVCDDVKTALNPSWMRQLFELETLEFIHPLTQRVVRIFDIPTEK